MTMPPMMRVLAGERVSPPPLWLMRQAGRYLPEYRAVRAQAKDFIDFCFSPDLAVEVTLQPLRRYALSASIVFADILLLPHVAGQEVRFEPGVGPVMDPIASRADVDALDFDQAADGLSPVYETLERVRAALDPNVTLIGFAGSPWTVATYMIGGGKDPNRWAARVAAYRDPEFVDTLLTRLADATAAYLIRQVAAGAQVLKLFDSWAESLPEPLFDRVIIEPTRRIVDAVRAAGVDVPIIGFPRGAGLLAAKYAKRTGVTALALDMTNASQEFLATLPDGFPVQGGFDPALLCAGGPQIGGEVERLLAITADRPYIFNLGHGVTPDVDPATVAALVDTVNGHG